MADKDSGKLILKIKPMKTLIIIIAIAFFVSIYAKAQEAVQLLFTAKYKTFYNLTSPKERLKGTTLWITDTTAIMIKSYIYNPTLTNYNYKIIPYQRIKTFKAQRMNKSKNSLIVCTLLGALGGTLIGIALAEDYLDGVGAGIGFAAGTVSGIVVGALIGMTKVVIPINGSKDAFAKEKHRLEKYSVGNF